MYEKIGIIAAMQSELSLLCRHLKNSCDFPLAGIVCKKGTIGSHEVVLMQCGIGKVSAALGTQAIITAFSPDCIINTGCAGALSSELSIGDIVLADAAAEWDLDLTALNFECGYISALDMVRMPTDTNLAEMLSDAAGETMKTVKGLIVSGDQFISSLQQREHILKHFPDALCAEMEGAAIAHVCHQNSVPFCILRCMSDTADGNSDVNFAEFSASAGEMSADILIKFLLK